MELSVKTLDSQSHTFKDLDEEITVLEFKSHISSTVTLPPEQQRLIFRGRVLQDDKKLKDYNVSSGQVVHLVARNPTSTSTSNDHPQPSNTSDGGGGGRNAIIMGTIGTVEFPSGGGPGSGPPPRRRNAAAVRITVANQCLTRASDLLRTLEDDVTNLHPQSGTSDNAEEDDEDGGIMDAIGRHHAATAAAVVASIQQRVDNVPGSSGPPEANRDGPRAPTPMSTESENGNPATGVPNTGNSGRPEAPMLRELATSINDVISLNARLTPYLQTVQRWLAENGDLDDNRPSVQYTYNAVSSILHSVSHSLHALSDITVDFALPPGQRRLRAPTSVWVEQSPVIRATIPIGVHLGVETTTVPNPNAQNALPPTGVPGPQFVGQGTMPIQLQQAINSIFQGVMSGQIPQQQQPPSQPPPPPIQWTGAGNGNVNPRPPPAMHPMMMNQLGNLFGQQGIQIQTGPLPTPPGINGQTRSNMTSGNATPTSGGLPGSRATTTGASPQGLPPQGLPLHPNMFMGPRPRMDQILLQCQSHHYAVNATLPSRPDNLESFLSNESSIPIGEEAAIFETFVSMLQGLNIIHPIINQYIRGSILRGRDINNSGHVTTGVRVYARKLVDWIVGSISASTGREFDTAGLTSRLLEVVTKFMSKVTEIILTTPAGSEITPALGSLLNEWMPSLLTALEFTFPPPGHLRILKGIILLIATTCFPSTSVVFRTHLTAGIAEYLMNCQPTPREPEPEHGMDHFEADVAMEIDVQFEHVDGPRSQMSTGPPTEQPIAPVSINETTGSGTSSLGVSGSRPLGNLRGSGSSSCDEDEEEGLEMEYRRMTDDLLRDLPAEWHPIVLNDLQRQEPLRTDPANRQPFSAGFLSLFPHK